MPNIDAYEISKQAHEKARHLINDIIDATVKKKGLAEGEEIMLRYGDAYNALVKIYALGYCDALDAVSQVLASTPDVTKTP